MHRFRNKDVPHYMLTCPACGRYLYTSPQRVRDYWEMCECERESFLTDEDREDLRSVLLYDICDPIPELRFGLLCSGIFDEGA